MRFRADDPRCRPVQLLNPLSASQSVMRTTILPSLLYNLQHNLNASRCASLALFEISSVFINNNAAEDIDENQRVAGIACGTRNTATWALPNRPVDIFDIKGCIEMLLEGLNIAAFHFKPGCDEPFLTPQTGMRVYIGDACCGVCGILHPDIAEIFDAETPVHVFELDFNLICTYHSQQKQYKSFSRFPAVQRDLALIIDQDVTAAEISAAIAAFNNRILTEWNIFDLYQGESIKAGKKSVAYRLTFQSEERTLTDNEVNKVHDKLLSYLHKQLNVELR
jgi:phenylalanyl-tRNA synthetase beta chain